MDVSRLKRVKMLLCDVDGVMTNGEIWLDSQNHWKRTFSVYDGVGLKMLMDMGYRVGVITGGKSIDVRTRMEFLGIEFFYEGIGDKTPPFNEILEKTGFKPDEVAYIGDELVDVPIIEKVGVGVSVPNGVREAREKAAYITKAKGGDGAVREICDLILEKGFYS
jgi:3-deoxy-D-manno-octulosonate 8-phosphate phosphatase (KDO 8-P phosphatase)